MSALKPSSSLEGPIRPSALRTSYDLAIGCKGDGTFSSYSAVSIDNAARMVPYWGLVSIMTIIDSMHLEGSR
jgi:hypothetical protein